LDPSYPAERLAFMLGDSGVPVLLTQRALLERIPPHAAQVLCLDRDADRVEAESHAPPAPRVDPDALAYVIYTSGSTGRPKGAMNAHRGVVNRLLWMQEAYGLDASDAVLQKTPFSFDVSVWELFWPLLAGARLVLARPGGHRDPAYLAEVVERERVTTLHFVPPMLEAFLEGAEVERCGSVRRVVCSGEALPWELTVRFFAALPRAELHNLYGPTEAAVDVTYHACGSVAERVVPIGRPVANTRVYVLDGEMNASPVGVPGELYIGGVQVGRGYLGRAGLTGERFVPDPYGGPGGRLYRTGDRARWLRAGEVEYLGRTDHQVKVRGFRIEPGEIEAALLGHPRVREATVVAREDGPGDRRLVAYLSLDGGAGATPGELRAYLLERLPEHMVPGVVVLLERLPLNANGKIDRRALPAPEWSAASAYVAPRTATEDALSGIWAEVLGAQRVGVEESVFELGGDSILAIQVVARARQRGLRLTPRQLFERSTVARLAEVVEPLDAGPDAASRGPHRRPEDPGGRTASDFPLAGIAQAEVDRLLGGEPGVDDVYPLTPMQEGMLFHCLYEGAGAYIGQFGFTLDGELDARAFERAWQGVVDRHPVLRTAFSWEKAEKPLQVVWRRATLPVHREDWRALTASGQEECFAAYLAADRARGVDPTEPPLMRLALFRTGEREHRLVWTIHHLVLDGWSVGLVYRDVLALYTGGREEHAARRRPYRDFIAWLGKQDPGRAEAFWRSELAGFGAATPPGIERSAAAGEGGNGSCRTVLGRERTAALRELSRRLRVTPATVVQGAWALLLSRYSGEEDVVFGATVSGRPAELDGVERMVGNFINTLPLRVRVDRDATVGAFLQGVQRKAAELREHEHSPLPLVQGWSEVEPGRPLFESFLSFQNLPVLASAEDAAAGGLAVRDAWSVEQANYPVALAAE
ncbi:MAG TPA: amino acid adenylation domain-containing protein, partial [Longimicrobiaceae bacterium]|nr:amino acid adenylation domain-containing protein [Longimicrobiaceae bacterium]